MLQITRITDPSAASTELCQAAQLTAPSSSKRLQELLLMQSSQGTEGQHGQCQPWSPAHLAQLSQQPGLGHPGADGKGSLSCCTSVSSPAPQAAVSKFIWLFGLVGFYCHFLGQSLAFTPQPTWLKSPDKFPECFLQSASALTHPRALP